MELLNRIFHNKNVKAVYYLRSALRYAMPRWLFRTRLGRVLAQARRREDWDYICDRVDYYNKLAPGTSLPPTTPSLAQHRYRKGVKTVYFFDTYEFTRWFPNRLLWDYYAGDIRTTAPSPTVVKSRPVGGDNTNSVLLNIDKVRHFVFLRDPVPFRKKQDRSIFRLAIEERPHRERFVKMYCGSECCDAGVVPWREDYPREWARPVISLYDHLTFKFIVALEGNDVATNLKWVMSSNSLAVMPRPTCESWFMEGRLVPDYHYVEIRDDYSDLEERMRYYIEHPLEAEAIIAHAHEFIAQFRDAERERIISLLVLDKYFRNTGQL